MADSPTARLAAGAVVLLEGLLMLSANVAGRTPRQATEVVAIALVVSAQCLLLLLAVRPGARWWLLLPQALLTFLPAIVFDNWLMSGGPLAAMALLTVAGAGRWVLFAAVVLSCGAIYSWTFPQSSLGYLVLAYLGLANTALALFGILRLSSLAREIGRARDELVGLALERERLQMRGRLRETLGDHLTVLAETLGRARAVAGTDPEAAGREAADAAALARRTLDGVRRVSDGYREIAPDRAEGEPAGVAPRLAWATLLFLLVTWTVQALLFHAETGSPPWGTVVFCVVLLGIAALQLGMARRPEHAWWMLGAQAVLVLVPMPGAGWNWAVMLGFLCGSALLVLRPPWGVAVLLGLLAARLVYPLVVFGSEYLGNVVSGVGSTLWLALIVFGLSRLARLSTDLAAARDQSVRMTVLNERLRVSRDVHDLLGFGLSAIALKGDVIRRLVTRDPARADRELAETAALAERVRAETAGVAEGGGVLPLCEEINAARSVLASAGIGVEISVSGEPSLAAAKVLAPVLREAVTNILRHSMARRVTIDCAFDGELVRLRVTNDGVARAVHTGGSPAPRQGTGLSNLTGRAVRAGGTLTAETGGDRFKVTAEVPA